MTPFNIDLLILNKQIIRQLGKVTNLAIMEPSTKNFTTDGLFSVEIFGPIGDPVRSVTFGYIDLKYPILHPLIYKHLCDLKTLYKNIMDGKSYAIWDNKEKDLVETTQEEGSTGYEFMLQHIDKILFNNNSSDKRDFKIKLIKKYSKPESFLKEWLVMPAGLRDYTIDDNGTPTEDEINDLYRKLLASVNSLESISVTEKNISMIDPIRIRVQKATLEIYMYVDKLLDGKNKFIQGKWGKRAITYGTRNVLTSIPSVIEDIDDENIAGFNDTVVGLYQYIAAISPLVKHNLHTKFINNIFSRESDIAKLVDPKTMKSVNVSIDPVKRDEWLTDEGLNNIINKLGQDVIRSEAVMVDGYYLMLVYDTGNKVVIINNTETMEDVNPKNIRPITYAELFYLSIYDIRNKYPAFLTRYPVADIGGIIPTKLYIKTTVNARTVKLVMNGIEKEVIEYPILKEKYFTSISVHPSKLGGLQGDYDGDTVSLNVLLTEDSVKEIDDFLNKKEYYIKPNGDLAHSMDIDPLNLVLKYLTDY